jgi:heme-degrading monooxygenase HmoA
MIRLTVFYNLAEGQDEEEFLKWRLTEHQESNASIPGVVRTDFARIDETWPPGTEPTHRFMTISEWPDRESFEAGFYDEEVQTNLVEDVKRIKDAKFFISEIIISEEPGQE